MSAFGHMNRRGAKHVGEPRVLGANGDRVACLYASAMVAKHAPAFAAIADQFEALFAPPAMIILARPDDPDTRITYMIPARLIPASYAPAPVQADFGDDDAGASPA